MAASELIPHPPDRSPIQVCISHRSSARSRGGRIPTALILAVAFAACGGDSQPEETPGEGAPDTVAGPIAVSDVGLATPESVLHDAEADVYLVSNINGTPVDKDDNGFYGCSTGRPEAIQGPGR